MGPSYRRHPQLTLRSKLTCGRWQWGEESSRGAAHLRTFEEIKVFT